MPPPPSPGASPLLAIVLTLAVASACGADSTEWVRANSGTAQWLWAAHGSGPRDVWAVGKEGACVRFNGQGWAPVPTHVSVDLNAVWAFSPNDAWIAGDLGTLLRWDGTAWSRVPLPIEHRNNLTGVFGSGSADVWFAHDMAGNDLFSGVLRWNGRSLEKVPFNPTSRDLIRIGRLWGSGPNDLWATGVVSHDFLRWDGTRWQKTSTGLSGYHSWRDLWASGPRDLWAIEDSGSSPMLLRFDGARFSPVHPERPRSHDGSDWLAVWSSGPDEVWLTGRAGEVLHWNGREWRLSSPGDYSSPDLFDVWGATADDLWAVGREGAIYRRTHLGR